MYPRSIYKITHIPTGRIYIGSSNVPKYRLESHMSALKHGRHPVEDMQADYDELGDNYDFSIIGQIKDATENHKEYDCMLECGSNIRGQGYNYKDRKCPHEKPFKQKPRKKKKKQSHLNDCETQLLDMVRNHSRPEYAIKMATIIITSIYLNRCIEDLMQEMKGEYNDRA